MSQEELDAMLKSLADDSGKAECSAENAVKQTGENSKKPLVQRVEFVQLKPRPRSSAQQPHGSLFNNIPLVLCGELGTADITVRELLALEEGSVIRLDKIAGDSATVLVNEQYLGQAETVVVNDRFGLRITTIGKEALRDKKEEPQKGNVSPGSPPGNEPGPRGAENNA